LSSGCHSQAVEATGPQLGSDVISQAKVAQWGSCDISQGNSGAMGQWWLQRGSCGCSEGSGCHSDARGGRIHVVVAASEAGDGHIEAVVAASKAMVAAVELWLQ